MYFVHNFWGAEFCSNHGFDTLVKRLKDGKKMCTDFDDFMEKRARIEERYGKDMVQLAKQAGGKEEIGSFRMAWDSMKTETENLGKAHLEVARSILQDLHKNLKEFRDQQKLTRRKTEDIVRRASKHKKSCFEKTTSAKSTYENKCKEADKADENFGRVQNLPTSKPTDTAKAQKKAQHARVVSENADRAYQDAVATLDEVRVLWEREMERLCGQFQDLEEQRVAFLRHTMWSLTNIGSQCCVDMDQMYEGVRQSLEECDVDADIELFVTTRCTGMERPAAILYVNYYNPSASQQPASAVAPVEDISDSINVPQYEPLPQSPYQPPHDTQSPYQPPHDMNGVVDTNTPVDDDDFDEEAVYHMPVLRVVAMYDYTSSGPDELSVQEGDIITVLQKEDDEWWFGELNNKEGMFPVSYVETLQVPP